MKTVAFLLTFLAMSGWMTQSVHNATAQVPENTPVQRYDPTRIAGEYYQGDGLGANLYLTINLDYTFKFRWMGCLGEYDKNHGKWKFEGDVLVLEPELPNLREGSRGTATRFIPVSWGERNYLVEESAVPAFTEDLRDGELSTSRMDEVHGYDYVQLDPETHEPGKTAGVPEVPTRYRVFYESGPIVAKLVEVFPNGTVKLDRGRKDGLWLGLMIISDMPGYTGEIQIMELAETTAIGRKIDHPYNERRMRIGDRFTTGSGRKRPRRDV